MASMIMSCVNCKISSVHSSMLGTSSRVGKQLNAHGLPQLNLRQPLRATTKFVVRASKQQEKQDAPLVGTKVEITAEQVNKTEQEEPLRVFDNTAAGKFFRPEIERRPEMGNTEFTSVMRFDGPAPETINGRLAMLVYVH